MQWQPLSRPQGQLYALHENRKVLLYRHHETLEELSLGLQQYFPIITNFYYLEHNIYNFISYNLTFICTF
jgi:hypothetical protein